MVSTAKQLQKQLRESQALLEISSMLAGTVDLATTLQQIADSANSLVHSASRTILHLLDDSGRFLQAVAISGLELPRPMAPMNFKLGEGIAGLALATGETINVGDTTRDPRYVPLRENQHYLRSLLVAPVKSGEKILGTLSVQSPQMGVFNADDERLLTILGVQAALAIEKAQLIRTEREQRSVAEALSRMSAELNRSLDVDTVLDLLLERVYDLVQYDRGFLYLADEVGECLINARGIERTAKGEAIPLRPPALAVGEELHELCNFPHFQALMELSAPVIVYDTEDDPELVKLRLDGQVASWAAVPVMGQDRILALLSLGKRTPGYYLPEHGRRLQAFANQASLALQNAKFFASTQQSLKETNLLYRLSQIISASLDTQEMLHQTVGLLAEHFGYYYVQVYLVDSETGDLVYAQGCGTANGPAQAEIKPGKKRLRQGQGIPGRAAQAFAAYQSNYVKADPYFVPDANLPLTQAELGLPLKTGARLLGILDIHQRAPHHFVAHDIQLITAIADQLALGIERTRLYSDLQDSLQHEKAARTQLVQSEKLAALGRIVASVTHELNNPLQAIQNALYLIQMEETLTGQAREDLKTVLNEADRMATMIARLRETYRPATSEEFHPESLNQLVEDVRKLLGTHLRHRNITFEFFPDELLPETPIIRDQIKQVILNICLNAVEAIASAMSDGGRIEVRTQYLLKTKGIQLIIADNGPSINPQVLPYIFDPFVTTKEGGTGLGLAISYDIVRRHNGHIEVFSEEGKGSQFTIWLPLQQRFDTNQQAALKWG